MNMIKHPVAASGPYAKFPILEMELEPLHELLRQHDVSELSVNRPGEIFVERLGATTIVHLRIDAMPPQLLRVVVPPDAPVTVDGRVGFRIDTSRIHLFDAQSGLRLTESSSRS